VADVGLEPHEGVSAPGTNAHQFARQAVAEAEAAGGIGDDQARHLAAP
jgi:hypothetical protein